MFKYSSHAVSRPFLASLILLAAVCANSCGGGTPGGVGLPPPPTVAVLTQHNDNGRTGLNAKETILTTANVKVSTFGKLFAQPVDGLIVGQPLYVPQVALPGLGKHNVVYTVTQHDSVYAFDADDNTGSNAAPLWSVSFLNVAAGATTVPISDQGCGPTTKFTEIGILPTPVIDTATGTIYVHAKTKENGNYVHRLHALDIATGQEKFGGPTVIAASVAGRLGTVNFDNLSQMERPALLLVGGTVYLSFGSSGCDGGPVHGWVMAYDARTLKQTVVFNTSPDDPEGRNAIWQAGAGPAADASGNLYFETANGPFDAASGGRDYGDSFMKLTMGSSGLTVADYFTPFNQQFLRANDIDLGSSGLVLLPDQPGAHPHLVVGSGKEGSVYVVDRDNMGHYNAVDNSQIVQFLDHTVGSMFSSPAYWNGTVYLAGQVNGLQSFSIRNGLLTPASQAGPTCCMHVPSISANGTSEGIVWIVDSNTLDAFDAIDLTHKLYTSKQAGTRDLLGTTAHFNVPTIANGKVYVGADLQLAVYGLL